MRSRLTFCLIGLVPLGGAGCSLVGSAAHVVAYRACQALEDERERGRNRRWAEEVWAAASQAAPGHHFSGDYTHGFVEGFGAFVYRGGSGEPPPLPPKEYRTLRYQTP